MIPDRRDPDPPSTARGPVAGAAVSLGVVLTLTSDRYGYGYERDELYFRMLRPASGYIDQPPLLPLVARATRLIADEPWALRIPATLAAVTSVFIVVAVCREVGGDRTAQTLCAWACAFAAAPLAFGHVLLTETMSLVFTPLIALFAIRAVRRDPRWWAATGAAIGAATFNKWLVALPVLALLVGALATRASRTAMRSWWFPAGVLLALIVMSPNLLYQAGHGWPQIHMARALHQGHAETRLLLVPYLALLLGPPLVIVWAAGLGYLARQLTLRFLAIAFPVLVGAALIGGGQLYYPLGLLTVVFAAGCLPVAAYLRRSRGARRAAWVLGGANAVVASTIGLPLVPVGSLGATPIPGLSLAVADQVGWPGYVQQIAAVYHDLPDRPGTIVYATNYGEAGAIDRFGPHEGLPPAYSGQNALRDTPPPPTTVAVVAVGAQLPELRRWFADCTVAGRLDNGVRVANEEQGQPIAVCRGPVAPWTEIWPALQHYD